MKGHVIMEIEPEEMVSIVRYYFEKELFDSYAGRERHRATVTDVRQRNNGNFVVEFDGEMPRTLKQLEANDATQANQT